MAKFLLANWNKIEGSADLKMARLAGRVSSALFYHAPSLVQHIDPIKERGGIYDRAMDFDANWKRTIPGLPGAPKEVFNGRKPAAPSFGAAGPCTTLNGTRLLNQQTRRDT